MSQESLEIVFEPVYKELYPMVYCYVHRFVGNQEEARQMTQQTFANFYEYICGNSSVKNPKALVYRIAGNICCDYLRRKRRERIANDEGILPLKTLSQPEEELLKKEAKAVFQKALSQLSSRDQQCLLLYYEGFSYLEIAECMKIKKTSVGKVLARAIEKIIRIINNGDKK
jgi:RNA polymerase sigma-70 factor (ECF subfamily)